MLGLEDVGRADGDGLEAFVGLGDALLPRKIGLESIDVRRRADVLIESEQLLMARVARQIRQACSSLPEHGRLSGSHIETQGRSLAGRDLGDEGSDRCAVRLPDRPRVGAHEIIERPDRIDRNAGWRSAIERNHSQGAWSRVAVSFVVDRVGADHDRLAIPGEPVMRGCQGT